MLIACPLDEHTFLEWQQQMFFMPFDEIITGN